MPFDSVNEPLFDIPFDIDPTGEPLFDISFDISFDIEPLGEPEFDKPPEEPEFDNDSVDKPGKVCPDELTLNVEDSTIEFDPELDPGFDPKFDA